MKIEKMKTKSYRDVPNYHDKLSALNSKGNLIPFASNCSLNRSVMFSNALSQLRAIRDGECPNVDTLYSYNIQQSTKNVQLNINAVVLYKFDKIILGHRCATTAYILYDEENDYYHYCEIPEYLETGHGYGIKMKNDIEEYIKNKETISAGSYITRTNSFNEKLEYQWGVNAVTALTIDPNTIEDAGLISDTLSEKMTGWTYATVEFNYDSSCDVLKNLYGDENTYKSIPLPGEEVENEIVYAIARNQKNSQYFKTGYGLDAVAKSDVKAFAKGKVVDIEIRQQASEETSNMDLCLIRADFEEYERNILDVMTSIIEEEANYSKEFLDKFNFLDAVYNKNMLYEYDNRIRSKKNIHVKLTIVEEVKPISGQKITGRCGNKFTVADVFEDGKYYTDTGKHIEYLGNGLALPNRAIMSPPIEMYMNKLSEVIYNYIKESKDSDDNKKKLLVGLFAIFREDIADVYTDVLLSRWEEFCENPYLPWYVDSYESGIDIRSIYKSFIYLKEHGIDIKREKLYMKSEEGGDDIYLGEVFVSKLFIAPLKQTAKSQASIRGLGTYDMRGVLIRTDSKRVRDTPVKQSPLVTDILCNMLHEDDVKTMNSLTDQESVQILTAYFHGMGLDLNNPNFKDGNVD